MTGYRHELLSNYSYVFTYYMHHFSVLQMLSANSADSYSVSGGDRLDIFRVGQRSRSRVHVKIRDHLGQEDHLLLSSQNI